jgi:small subunit ribosomal protein S3Ae
VLVDWQRTGSTNKMAIGKLRGKKKWFTVLAPELFNSKELVEITGYETKELVGRPVEINLAQLTERPKDQYKKLILKIVDTKGEKAITVPWKFYIAESFVQRTARRYKERLYETIELQSKDNKKVGIKFFILAVKRLHHSVRADILRLTEKMLAEAIASSGAFELFTSESTEKLTNEITKEIRRIYPIDKLLIWKIFVN